MKPSAGGNLLDVRSAQRRAVEVEHLEGGHVGHDIQRRCPCVGVDDATQHRQSSQAGKVERLPGPTGGKLAQQRQRRDGIHRGEPRVVAHVEIAQLRQPRHGAHVGEHVLRDLKPAQVHERLDPRQLRNGVVAQLQRDEVGQAGDPFGRRDEVVIRRNLDEVGLALDAVEALEGIAGDLQLEQVLCIPQRGD